MSDYGKQLFPDHLSWQLEEPWVPGEKPMDLVAFPYIQLLLNETPALETMCRDQDLSLKQMSHRGSLKKNKWLILKCMIASASLRSSIRCLYLSFYGTFKTLSLTPEPGKSGRYDKTNMTRKTPPKFLVSWHDHNLCSDNCTPTYFYSCGFHILVLVKSFVIINLRNWVTFTRGKYDISNFCTNLFSVKFIFTFVAVS